jgi:mono/diheme cytochrome c family protein
MTQQINGGFFALVCACALLAACGGGGTGNTDEGPNTLVLDLGLAYVKRPLPDTTAVDIDVREPGVFLAGGNLLFRDLAAPSAAVRNVTHALLGDLGDVRDVEMSYDGDKVLFAMHLPAIEDADPEDQPTWNIWEYAIATRQLRRVIASDLLAEEGRDIAPHYLPDGRIIFASTRQHGLQGMRVDEGKPQFQALDEDRNVTAFSLHVMDADGENIHQVSFNPSHDLDPAVLDSGQIVFSRWDNINNHNAINLYRMNPDGSDLQLLYGAHSHGTGSDATTVEFMHPREAPDNSIMLVLRPGANATLGGDIVRIDVGAYLENTQPTAADIGILTGPAQTSLSVNTVRTDDLPSPGGRFNAIYPLWDGTDRAFVSWSPCRLLEIDVIVPCLADKLAAPQAVEAPPLYSLYLYDMAARTQVPVFTPEEGFMYTDVAAAQPRALPAIIPDLQPDANLSYLLDENAGVLNIRSVYDYDGLYNALGGTAPDLATLADPQLITAAERPARFLRVIKGVGIPDRDTKIVPGSAFGVSAAQLMREIVGYAPIEPDGSVKVKVPANVPLMISVLDANGRRVNDRHENWLQVQAGEVVTCNGCHAANSGVSHGRADAFTALNSGAPFDGYQFPHTEAALWAEFGETMAEARTRLVPAALTPSPDLRFTDVWTDETAAGRAKDPDINLLYADLDTPMPTGAECQTAWTSLCRTIINYAQHIHPLWSLDRGADTCTTCHTTANLGLLADPDPQLDLSDGPSPDVPAQFNAYRELLAGDFAQLFENGVAGDIFVQAIDGNGDPLFETDANGDLILDIDGNPIPIMVRINVPASMSASGARFSNRFFSRFAPGGTHAGRLTDAELRLLSEWLDIGAQYYNNPFDVP